MKSLLEEIYYMLEPAVKIKGDSWRIIDLAEKKFCKKLKGKDRKLYYDYAEAYAEFSALVGIENFKQGFKMGCELMRELR